MLRPKALHTQSQQDNLSEKGILPNVAFWLHSEGDPLIVGGLRHGCSSLDCVYVSSAVGKHPVNNPSSHIVKHLHK
jgi:hypothetical protein